MPCLIEPHIYESAMPCPIVSLLSLVAMQVIAIAMDDPLAKQLDDISDVERELPGYVSGIREWFRWYKTPDDKPLNNFGFEENALNKVRNVDKILSLWNRLRSMSLNLLHDINTLLVV